VSDLEIGKKSISPEIGDSKEKNKETDGMQADEVESPNRIGRGFTSIIRLEIKEERKVIMSGSKNDRTEHTSLARMRMELSSRAEKNPPPFLSQKSSV
jgi:hypothetical protein